MRLVGQLSPLYFIPLVELVKVFVFFSRGREKVDRKFKQDFTWAVRQRRGWLAKLERDVRALLTHGDLILDRISPSYKKRQ